MGAFGVQCLGLFQWYGLGEILVNNLTLFLHTVHEVEPTGPHLDCCQVWWCLAYLPQACWLHHVAFLLITSPDSTDYVCSSLRFISQCSLLEFVLSLGDIVLLTYLLTYIHVLGLWSLFFCIRLHREICVCDMLLADVISIWAFSFKFPSYIYIYMALLCHTVVVWMTV